jgi:cysteine desulfurase/selenocysteine lyase
MAIFSSESERLNEFPIARDSIFLAHAGVTILPARVTCVMRDYLHEASFRMQEFPEAWRATNETRAIAAKMIGAKASEIALLGPTSLGLSLVANGLDWQPGDEVVCYADDYPANVYPWTDLERRGVIIRKLKPKTPGEITPELVETALTSQTRLVALASCHYLTGYRLQVNEIGKMLRARNILFCLDAIQTLGAFETTVEHVDFLAADSHKWMLGPMAAGIVYVREEMQERLRPTLLGSWNVHSPQFIAQPDIVFEKGGRRYEPGVLNIVGILGMKAGLELLLEKGIPEVSAQLLRLKEHLIRGLEPMGFHFIGPRHGPNASGITTVFRSESSGPSLEQIFNYLTSQKISPSLRHDRQGKAYLRFSPHFYNTIEEMDRVIEAIRSTPN